MLPTETAISAPPLPVRHPDPSIVLSYTEQALYELACDGTSRAQAIQEMISTLEKLRDEESVRILVDMPETPESQHGSLEATQVYDGPEPLEYALFPETRRPESVWTGSEATGPLARLLDDAYHRGHDMV